MTGQKIDNLVQGMCDQPSAEIHGFRRPIAEMVQFNTFTDAYQAKKAAASKFFQDLSRENYN